MTNLHAFTTWKGAYEALCLVWEGTKWKRTYEALCLVWEGTKWKRASAAHFAIVSEGGSEFSKLGNA